MRSCLKLKQERYQEDERDMKKMSIFIQQSDSKQLRAFETASKTSFYKELPLVNF
ncbi:hypothetical protein DPMN_159314 [Dreissena polymorpha]|uniref:Uncharacterized protein n=1 Tax=Dreissena polymorpha TaxID=45954 RepID=A0A9D4ELB4_DREPO|nr:hypothetical protein DPMN_159314 [Dreissena polymorpha]